MFAIMLVKRDLFMSSYLTSVQYPPFDTPHFSACFHAHAFHEERRRRVLLPTPERKRDFL